MMASISNCLANANDDIKEKFLRKIVEYTDRCNDKALIGLQIIGCMALAYGPVDDKDNSSLEKRIIAILVDLYKKAMLSRSLAFSGSEELEGLTYLTRYLGYIIFPRIYIPEFHYTIIGARYTEDEGNSLKNFNKIFDKINHKDWLVDFVCDGVYDCISVGEMLFEEILKNDQEYMRLKIDCEGQDFTTEPFENPDNTKIYASNDAEIYWSLSDDKADEFHKNILFSRQEALNNYKKAKAKMLLRKYGYIY
jgi:hypothetical protein